MNMKDREPSSFGEGLIRKTPETARQEELEGFAFNLAREIIIRDARESLEYYQDQYPAGNEISFISARGSIDDEGYSKLVKNYISGSAHISATFTDSHIRLTNDDGIGFMILIEDINEKPNNQI